MLPLIKPDILENAFVVNATLANAESLRDKLELSGKVFSSSNDEKDHDLIRYFYSDFDDDCKDKVNIVGGKLETTFTLKEDLKDIVSTSAEIHKDAITSTAKAVKEGLKDTMFCKHCGNEIDVDSKYCRFCGKEQ